MAISSRQKMANWSYGPKRPLSLKTPRKRMSGGKGMAYPPDDDEDLEEDEEAQLYKHFPIKKLRIVSPTTKPWEPTVNPQYSSH